MEWNDQGWGYQKGKVALFAVDRLSGDVKELYRTPIAAPHSVATFTATIELPAPNDPAAGRQLSHGTTPPPPPAPAPPPPYTYPETLSIEGNPAYPSVTRGQYTRAAGLEYGGAPVYKRSYYSLYKRSNGKWYLDFNEVDESWSGTVNYALHASDTPFTATWNADMVVVPN